VAKRAAIKVGRCTHAHQFRRARRELKFLRTRLGRVIRGDICRKINRQPDLEGALPSHWRWGAGGAGALSGSPQHGPEGSMRCTPPRSNASPRARPERPTSSAARACPRKSKGIGGNAGDQSQGRQFVLNAKALHGGPFDGHSLGPVIAELERQTGVETRRIHVDKGYRGHNHPQKFRVWISGQVRRATAQICRNMKRRGAVEPIIGHLKAEHRMGRNHLTGRDGDRANAVLARRRLQLRAAAALAGAAFARAVSVPPSALYWRAKPHLKAPSSVLHD
jgi:IS5 family transposase